MGNACPGSAAQRSPFVFGKTVPSGCVEGSPVGERLDHVNAGRMGKNVPSEGEYEDRTGMSTSFCLMFLPEKKGAASRSGEIHRLDPTFSGRRMGIIEKGEIFSNGRPEFLWECPIDGQQHSHSSVQSPDIL